jgi:hypothetical protein
VDLRKGSGSESYYLNLALVDLGATHDFFSLSIAAKLRLEAVKAGRKRNRKKKLPPITTVNGKLLCSTTVVQHMLRMCISSRKKQSLVINFFVANIIHYD